MPHFPEPFDRTPLASHLCRSILRNESEKEASAEGDVIDEVNLNDFLRANESAILWQVESLVLQQVTRAIGRENLEKISLTFQGSFPDDLAVHVEGPPDLKAKVEEALRAPSRHVSRSEV
ncbi:MAG TPA: hypothetical protein VKF17_12495 [Isosphaeraceae bacterium]|nr:hypothetical protein [Isosphaeraceae bacterium]